MTALFKAICEFWKRRIASLVLLLCFLAVGVYWLYSYKVREDFSPPGKKDRTDAVEILDGVRLRQPLAVDKPIKRISIKLAASARKSRGKIRFCIKDDAAGKVLYETQLEMADVAEDQSLRVSFHRPIKIESGRRIAFYIEGTPDCRPGNAVACLAKESDHPGYWKNGSPTNKTLVFTASLRYTRKWSWWWFVLVAAAVLLMLLPADSKFWNTKCGVFWKNRIFASAVLLILVLEFAVGMPENSPDMGYWPIITAFAAVFLLVLGDGFLLNAVKSPEKIFLVVGGLSIMAIFYFSPMLDGEDAINHLIRIYQISEGKILFHPSPAEKVSRDERQWLKTLSEHGVRTRSGHTPFSERRTLLSRRAFKAETMNRKHYLMGYTPLAYLPYVGVVYYARKAGLCLADGLVLIYVLAALVYWLAMYFVIRAIPAFKWEMLIFALTPAVVYHGISYSADAFLILVASCFFMLVMKLREADRPYSRLQLLLMAALSVALCQCKFVYFPMLGMLFLLPAENFRSGKRRLVFVAATIFAAVFLGWLWNKLATDYSVFLNLDGRSTAEKTAFVARHPWRFFMMWIYTQFPRKLPITLQCAFDCLGTRDVLSRHGDGSLFPSLFPGVAVIIAVLYVSTACFIRERALKWWGRVSMLLLFMWSVGLIYVAVFCINMIKNGIQGRYLLPLFPLLFLALGQKRFGLPERYLPYYKGFLVLFLVAVQLLTADALRRAYWI